MANVFLLLEPFQIILLSDIFDKLIESIALKISFSHKKVLLEGGKFLTNNLASYESQIRSVISHYNKGIAVNVL